jgi:hypothetical protein
MIDARLPTFASRRSYELLGTTQEHLQNASIINFKGERYINFAQLESLFNTSLVHDLLCYSEDQSADQSADQEGSRFCHVKDHIDEIKSRALRLLALCIWPDIPLRTFSVLFTAGIRDEDLPLRQNFTHSLIDPATVGLLLEYQSRLIPYSIIADGAFHKVAAGWPLPIQFDELEDRIGRGSLSEVFRVEVNSGAHPFNQVQFYLLPYLS